MIANARTRLMLAAGLTIAAAAFLLPQLWLFSLSLKSKAGIYEYPPRWIPADGSFANYRFALTHTQVPWYLWNSAIVAIAAAAATLAAAVPAAYVLSRERFDGRRGLLAGRGARLRGGSRGGRSERRAKERRGNALQRRVQPLELRGELGHGAVDQVPAHWCAPKLDAAHVVTSAARVPMVWPCSRSAARTSARFLSVATLSAAVTTLW